MNKRGRPKGIPKPPGSGRQKGQANLLPSKRSIDETLRQALERLNFDPLAKLIEVIEKVDPVEQGRIVLAMMPYLHAQVKAQETPQQPAFQVFANVDRAALLQAVNSKPEGRHEFE